VIARRLFTAWLLALAGFGPAAAQTIGGEFTLQDGAGRQVSQDNFAGRYRLVFFGYTNCPDICPVGLYNIARALALLGPQAGQWAPLFITVDPVRDTPAQMGRYTSLFSRQIIGLTGTPAQIAGVERAYHVYVAPPDPKTGAIQHSDILFILSPQGHFITGLPANTAPAALAMVLRQAMRGGLSDASR
jgi:protein SCO1/2